MTLNVSFHVCPCSHLYRTLFLPHCLFFVCVYVCFLMMIKIPSLVVGCVNSALGGWAQSTSPSLSPLSQNPLPRSCMYTCVLCIRIDNLDLQIFHTHTHTHTHASSLNFFAFFCSSFLYLLVATHFDLLHFYCNFFSSLRCLALSFARLTTLATITAITHVQNKTQINNNNNNNVVLNKNNSQSKKSMLYNVFFFCSCCCFCWRCCCWH